MHYNLMLVINANDPIEDLDELVDERMQPYSVSYSGNMEVPEANDLWYDWYAYGRYPSILVRNDGRNTGVCRLKDFDIVHTDFDRFSAYADDDYAVANLKVHFNRDGYDMLVDMTQAVMRDRILKLNGNPLLVAVNYHN